jgi:hypothetical protein
MYVEGVVVVATTSFSTHIMVVIPSTPAHNNHHPLSYSKLTCTGIGVLRPRKFHKGEPLGLPIWSPWKTEDKALVRQDGA